MASWRRLVDRSENITIERQCELLGLSRSSYYYTPQTQPTADDVVIMNAIDRLHTAHPYFGYRRIQSHLQDELSAAEQHLLPINHKKIQHLMQIMAIKTQYPKKDLSRRNPEHKVFPYLLRNVPITRPRQVYSTDITYIPMSRGFMYLTAVIDWYSRYVLSWRVSNTMTTDFCIDVVQEAFTKHGVPEIFNTDQGSQYTSKAFTELILDNKVQFSMDGKGRALDNVYCERQWRTVKQEYVYIFVPENGLELYKGLSQYYEFYNHRRRHQSLNDQVPSQLFFVS